MATKKSKKDDRFEIQEIQMSEISMFFLGRSPMIMNRFAQKAWQELLFPSVKTNRVGLESSLKHDPFNEYRGAVYRTDDVKSKALIHVPNGAFHGALASAALDMPGSAKAKIERLTKVIDLNIELFGVPQIFCAMVRNSDISRTPDVRTRPIFVEWAGKLTVRYVRNLLTERTVVNLMGAAGAIVGIGDWRSQKGGPFGEFGLVGEKDRDWNRIVKTQGRAAQQKALDHPTFYDANTEELLVWFEAEVKRREMDTQLAGVDGKKPRTKLPKVPIIIEKGAGRDGGEYVGVEQ